MEGEETDDLIDRKTAVNIMTNAVRSLPLSEPRSRAWVRVFVESELSKAASMGLSSRDHENDPDHIADAYKEDDSISRQAAIDAISCDITVTGRQNAELVAATIGIFADRIKALPSAQPEPPWIPCSERMPECEQEVLICTKIKLVGKDAYIDSIITPALYEDGTMLENESKWHWEDIDYEKWDEEEDCGVIPEGWWENRHFNPDDVYNNVVDREVVAWMPLPEPYAERREE